MTAPRLRTQGRSAPRRGFSLTEASIVLGIIGLVLGAIWAAIAAVEDNVKSNDAATQLSVTMDRARAYYAGQNVTYAAVTAAKAAAGQGNLQIDPGAVPPPVLSSDPPPTVNDFAYYTPLILAAGVFPPDMLDAAGAKHPWGVGGSAQMALACGAACAAGNTVQIVVRYAGLLTSDICSDLVLKNSQPDVGLTKIMVNGSLPNGSAALPVNAADVSVACSGAATYTIDWYYNINGM